MDQELSFNKAIIMTNNKDMATKPEAKANLFFLSAIKKIGRFINAANDINPPNFF